MEVVKVAARVADARHGHAAGGEDGAEQGTATDSVDPAHHTDG